MYQGSRFLQCTSLITETALSLAACTMNLGGCIPIRCHQARLLISMETPPPPPLRPGPAPAAVDKQPRPPCMCHLVNTDPASWASRDPVHGEALGGQHRAGILCPPPAQWGRGLDQETRDHTSRSLPPEPSRSMATETGLRALYTHTDMHAYTCVHTHIHTCKHTASLSSAGGEYACACREEKNLDSPVGVLLPASCTPAPRLRLAFSVQRFPRTLSSKCPDDNADFLPCRTQLCAKRVERVWVQKCRVPQLSSPSCAEEAWAPSCMQRGGWTLPSAPRVPTEHMTTLETCHGAQLAGLRVSSMEGHRSPCYFMILYFALGTTLSGDSWRCPKTTWGAGDGTGNCPPSRPGPLQP